MYIFSVTEAESCKFCKVHLLHDCIHCQYCTLVVMTANHILSQFHKDIAQLVYQEKQLFPLSRLFPFVLVLTRLEYFNVVG